jgi:anti-sigma regulatory factor (Ser/Thr protein kinase)
MDCSYKTDETHPAAKEAVYFPPRGGTGWYNLDLPARIDAVGPLCAFLTILCERHDLTAEETRSVEISTYETCLNVIEHAYDFDPEARIRLRIRLEKDRIVLSFYDRGTSFDPKSIPPPDMSDPSVRLRGRGFGLQIIRNSVDVMRYRLTTRGENNLLLIKLLDRGRMKGTGASALAWREGGAA